MQMSIPVGIKLRMIYNDANWIVKRFPYTLNILRPFFQGSALSENPQSI
jgi:hypothetical protein